MPIYIENVIIEVTRRCNMKCAHCLRGNAQGIDMEFAYIRKFLEKIAGGRIGTLTFTGGEPSLRADIIDYIRLHLSYNKIELQNFYIATNGKTVTKDFVDVCFELYGQCTDNEISAVHLSNDYRHKEQGSQQQGDRLSCFSFFNKKHDKDGKTYELIKQGRAKDWGTREKIEDWIYKDTNGSETMILESQIYLNCLGEIINGCDRSYAEQKNHKICDVSDDFVSKILDIAKELE